tara:strand:- start:199 stop:498 length:300 start_codon:yes stop_codon:yes gene_type:complete
MDYSITLRTRNGVAKSEITVEKPQFITRKTTHNRDGIFDHFITRDADGVYYETRSSGGCTWRKAPRQDHAGRQHEKARQQLEANLTRAVDIDNSPRKRR